LKFHGLHVFLQVDSRFHVTYRDRGGIIIHVPDSPVHEAFRFEPE
jgi:hypothetical protein